QLPVFMVGFVTYSLHARIGGSSFARGRLFSTVLLVAGAALLYFSLEHALLRPQRTLLDSPSSPFSWLEIKALAFGLITLSVALRPPVWLVNRVTVFLGRISFSLYLCHPVVVFFVKAIGVRAEAMWGAKAF